MENILSAIHTLTVETVCMAESTSTFGKLYQLNLP